MWSLVHRFPPEGNYLATRSIDRSVEEPNRVGDVLTRPAGVTSVAAGAGAVWATVPDDHALWRIDPSTEETTRIPLRYFPWGVAVGDDGIWVTVRAHDAA